MKNQIKNVEEFHNSFNIKNNNIPTVNVGETTLKLRQSLMNEENEEYLDACKQGDLVEIADALGDMMYILFGTILSHGLQHRLKKCLKRFKKAICLN